MIAACEQCGEPHVTRFGGPACSGHSSQTGKACRQPPNHGMSVCENHGGATPQAIAARDRRANEQALESKALEYGNPREVEPQQAIREELWRTAGLITGYELQVREQVRLHGHDGLWQFRDASGLRWQRPSVLLELLASERKHYLDVAVNAVKLGLEEREVQMLEQIGDLVVGVFHRAMDDPELGLSDAQRSIAASVIQRGLAELGRGEG